VGGVSVGDEMSPRQNAQTPHSVLTAVRQVLLCGCLDDRLHGLSTRPGQTLRGLANHRAREPPKGLRRSRTELGRKIRVEGASKR